MQLFAVLFLLFRYIFFPVMRANFSARRTLPRAIFGTFFVSSRASYERLFICSFVHACARHVNVSSYERFFICAHGNTWQERHI